MSIPKLYGKLCFKKKYVHKNPVSVIVSPNVRAMVKLAIIGDFNPTKPTHLATNEAIEHASKSLSVKVAYEWVETSQVDEDLLEMFQGLWIAPGPPYENLSNCLNAIKYARVNKVPLLGTCQGFQTIILEYVQNVSKISDASHQEYTPNAKNLLITESACSLVGKAMDLTLVPRTIVAEAYNSITTTEKYYCSFEINRKFYDILKASDMVFAGMDKDGSVRVIELSNHPFFIGTLFVPQVNSSMEKHHPLVKKFINTVELRG
jgi:CTP synthase (UTP-ammonia lyase)